MASSGTQSWDSHVFISGALFLSGGAVIRVNRNLSVAGRVDITNGSALYLDDDAQMNVHGALMVSSGGQLHFYVTNRFSYNASQCVDASTGIFHVYGVSLGLTVRFPISCVLSYPGTIIAHTNDPCVVASITYNASGITTVYSGSSTQGCAAMEPTTTTTMPPWVAPAKAPAKAPATSNPPPKATTHAPSISRTGPEPDNGANGKELSLGFVALILLLLALK
jgi:hypothetical protein